ncbi:TNFAIP3-interacting protein 3 isoform X2 [Narcine bancroftii]|uniref:TNFAIP3-interacting protein 3 isoform X2 n=1 Tax=Narcine bancroftii TaxID=1343680 RepID=UPI003831615B
MDTEVELTPHCSPQLATSPTLGKTFLLQRQDASKSTAATEVAFGLTILLTVLVICEIKIIILRRVSGMEELTVIHRGSISRKQNEPFQTQNGTELGDEETVTFITESMSVTTADEEKLLLLNRNTELRRINQKLMKLNQDWDQIYRITTSELQQRVAGLQMEVSETNQHACTLSKKLDNEQCKREYYEQSFMQEMKKNQQLQEYVRQLENKLHTLREQNYPSSKDEPWRPTLSDEKVVTVPQQPEKDKQEEAPMSVKHMQIMAKSREPDQCRPTKPETAQCAAPYGISQKDCKELLDQMAALMCQTKLFESDYKTERKDRQRTQAENVKLKKVTEDMYLQMNLLQEQLKIYEDDFKRERSDKQILQRLLKSKAENKEPVLVHRCNNTHQKSPEIKRLQCAKHCIEHSNCSNHHRCKGAEIQAVPYSIDYH